jgi:tetratricopeptide (TPR) repeat protein
MRLDRTVAIGAALLAACRGPSDGEKPRPIEQATIAPAATPSAEVDAGPPRPIRGKPKGDAELPTTAGPIAMANLDGQIADLTRMLKTDPKRTAFLRELAAAHHLRGRVRSDLDEIDEGLKTTTKIVELEPLDPTAYLDRAVREEALHRLADAQSDVDRARKLGANAHALASVQADLDWSAGKYDIATAQIVAARQRKPSASTWTREAILRFDLGEMDAADRAFEEAEDRLGDELAPFHVAQIDVLRGIMKQETGQLDAAVLFFREALRRVPAHVAAAEHLAETLHWLDKDDEAITTYEELVKRTPDPEPMGALAAIYRAKGKTKEADATLAKAKARYEELIKKYPEAMAGHAAEFFLGPGGDPKRALELLEKNAELRPNAESWVQLAEAELANGKTAEAKATIDKTVDTPLESARKFLVAARVYEKAGDAKKARSLLKRATSINPAIERIEKAR